MSITRRALLRNGIKTGVGVVLLRELALDSVRVSAQAPPQADRLQAVYPRLDEYIARHMSEMGLPGMTLALADRNGLLRSLQYGFADVKAGVKVAPQTMFEIGSISKSFVAIAVLQLAEEGKLDLQKPVTNYLPWLKIDSKFAPFTTHHLLSHISLSRQPQQRSMGNRLIGPVVFCFMPLNLSCTQPIASLMRRGFRDTSNRRVSGFTICWPVFRCASRSRTR